MKILSIILTFLFLIPLTVLAEDKQIFINEFAIEPIQKVEILNSSNADVDISGWFIDDNGGSMFFTIPENTILSTQKCIVFEGIFNLNKTSPDTVQLFDSTANPPDENANLVDSYTYPQSPGDGKSYLRIPDGTDSWEINSSSFGKNNLNGESCEVFAPTNTPTISPTPKTTPTSSPTPVPQVYSNIYLSEVMVSPHSGEYEWVELYNGNDFDVTLTNWYIDDMANGGSSPRLFTLTVPKEGYGIVDLLSGIFNNSDDSVRLLDNASVLKHEFSYTFSEKGYTWGAQNKTFTSYCIQSPTRNANNSGCIAVSDNSPPSTLAAAVVSPPQVRGQSQSTTHTLSTANSRSHSYYRVAVTPPTLLSHISPQVLRAHSVSSSKETSDNKSQLPFLAGAYSLLSGISLGLKVYLKQGYVTPL